VQAPFRAIRVGGLHPDIPRIRAVSFLPNIHLRPPTSPRAQIEYHLRKLTATPDADAPHLMKTTRINIRSDLHLPLSAASVLLVLLPTHAISQGASTEVDAFDTLWGYANLYKDDTNHVIEEFKLRGRYQGQYWDVDADQGSQSNWEDRRSRFGFDAKLFDKKIEARLDFQSNDSFDDFYEGLVDAYIRWKPTESLTITAGKIQPLIAQFDWLESTTVQQTFERSQLFGQFGINRASGLTVEGTTDDFSWRGGIYSNATPGTTGGTGSFGDGEFGDFNGGVSFSLGGGYNFKNHLGIDKADFHFDWLHSDREPGDFVLGKYDDLLSSSFSATEGRLTVLIEGYFASGGDGTNSNVIGFYIEPLYDLIAEKLQLVGRYSHSQSMGDLGVVGQSRSATPTTLFTVGSNTSSMATNLS
jgi:phosphate-selective porin OprO/OprP